MLSPRSFLPHVKRYAPRWLTSLTVFRIRFRSTGVRSGSVRGPFGVRSGSVQGPFGIRSGSFRGPFEVRSRRIRGRLGSVQDHSGSVRDPFGVRSGSVQGPFGLRLQSERKKLKSTCFEIFSETPLVSRKRELLMQFATIGIEDPQSVSKLTSEAASLSAELVIE